jgi:hypothetical protein
MRCTKEIGANLCEKRKTQAKSFNHYALAMVEIHAVHLIFIRGTDGAFLCK